MKFNWGTGITIVIILFMSFILFMVFKATNTKSDLHAVDYYHQEINYQTKIDAVHNAKKLMGEIVINQKKDRIAITYPIDFKEKKISGTIHFFKPDNASFDRVFEIEANQNQQYFSKKDLVGGWYLLKINWKSEGVAYFHEKRIQIK